MTPLANIQGLLIAGAAGLALGFGGGWLVNGWRLDSNLADLKVERAQLVEAIETKKSERIEEVRKSEKEHAAALSEAYKTIALEERKNEKLEGDLLAAVERGNRKLLIRASCPPSGGVPSSPGSPSAGNGTAVELDSAARQDYYALRSALRSDDEKLITLQAWATEAVKLCGASPHP